MTAFRVERDALAKAAALAARIARNAAPFDATRLEVDGDKLTVSADNGDVAVATTLAVADGAAGAVGVPAKRLAEATKAMRPGAVAVGYDEVGKTLRLSCGPSRAELPTIDVGDLPRSAAMGEGRAIDRDELVGAIERVLPAASRDDARPILTGVLFEAHEGTLQLVATDSFRLYRCATSCGWDDDALVPAMALAELVRLDDEGALRMEADRDSVTFGVGSTVLRSRLIEGQYPNYGQLITSTTPHRLVVSGGELAEVVKRVDFAARDGEPVRLAMESEAVTVTAHTLEVATAVDVLGCRWDGPEMTVAYNPAFLADVLAAAGPGDVAIGITDPLKPVMVRGADESWLGLIMPVRTS